VRYTLLWYADTSSFNQSCADGMQGGWTLHSWQQSADGRGMIVAMWQHPGDPS